MIAPINGKVSHCRARRRYIQQWQPHFRICACRCGSSGIAWESGRVAAPSRPIRDCIHHRQLDKIAFCIDGTFVELPLLAIGRSFQAFLSHLEQKYLQDGRFEIEGLTAAKDPRNDGAGLSSSSGPTHGRSRLPSARQHCRHPSGKQDCSCRCCWICHPGEVPELGYPDIRVVELRAKLRRTAICRVHERTKSQIGEVRVFFLGAIHAQC